VNNPNMRPYLDAAIIAPLEHACNISLHSAEQFCVAVACPRFWKDDVLGKVLVLSLFDFPRKRASDTEDRAR
jgi:hypothetical protein